MYRESLFIKMERSINSLFLLLPRLEEAKCFATRPDARNLE